MHLHRVHTGVLDIAVHILLKLRQDEGRGPEIDPGYIKSSVEEPSIPRYIVNLFMPVQWTTYAAIVEQGYSKVNSQKGLY